MTLCSIQLMVNGYGCYRATIIQQLSDVRVRNVHRFMISVTDIVAIYSCVRSPSTVTLSHFYL